MKNIFQSDAIIPITLVDTSETTRRLRKRKAIVRINELGIGISVEGFADAGTKGFGEPIFIEFYNGKLLVRCYADINKEDPTMTVEMSGALESNRKTQ